MDAHRAAADLRAVPAPCRRRVRARRPGSALSATAIVVDRRRERVMHRRPALCRPASHSNIGKSMTHRGAPAGSSTMTEVLAHLEPAAPRARRSRPRPCPHRRTSRSPVCAPVRCDAGPRRPCIRQELEDRRLQALTPPSRRRSPSRTRAPSRRSARRTCRAIVDLLARQLLAAARHAQRCDAAILASAAGAGEHLEVAVAAPGLQRRRVRAGCAGPACRTRSAAWPPHSSCAGTGPAAQLSRAPCLEDLTHQPLPSGPGSHRASGTKSRRRAA